MDIKDFISRIESSSSFMLWKKKNNDAFLSNVFVMSDSAGQKECQLSYYHSAEDRITTMTLDKNELTISQQDEVFKKPEDEVRKLEAFSMGYDDALAAADALRRDRYKGEIPVKTIAILQNIKKYGTVWNVLFVTSSMKIINIKLSADDGSIKDSSMAKIADMAADE
jgi:hypothetical protein